MAVYKDDANLQALWLFENNLLDDTINDNDLTDNNTVGYDNVDFQEGAYALELDAGSSEYGSITDGDQTGLDFTGSFSIVGWIKFVDGSGTDCVISKWGGSGDQSYYLEINDSRDMRITVRNNADSATATAIGGTTLSTATWYHVAAVYNGTDMRVYVDGLLDSNGADNPKTFSGGVNDGTAPVYVGRLFSAYYNGHIDELGVFDRALSAAEVLDIKNNGIQDAVSGNPWYAYAQQ